MERKCRIFSFVGINHYFSIGYYQYASEDEEEQKERERDELESIKLLERYSFLLSYDEEMPYAEAEKFIHVFKICGMYIEHSLFVYNELYTLFNCNRTKNIIYTWDNYIISAKLFEKIKKKTLSRKNIVNQLIENIGNKFFIYNKKFLYIPYIDSVYSAKCTGEYVSTLNGEKYIVLEKDDKLNTKIDKESKNHIKYLENLICEQGSLQDAVAAISNIHQQPQTPENFLLKKQLPSKDCIDEWILHMGIEKLERILLDTQEIQIQGNNISCKFASALISAVTSENLLPEKIRNWYKKGKIPGIKSDKIYVAIFWVLEYLSAKLQKDIFCPILLLPDVAPKK